MFPRTTTRLWIGIGAACLLCVTFASQAQQSNAKKKAKREAAVKAEDRVPVEVARDRAKLMHKIYESTLHSMHRHYFRNGKSTLPARAMEDVFSEMLADTKSDARWIAVNTPAMSIDHEPETEFEKQAAKAISSGTDQIELVENGFYRQATAIPLGAGCASCHNGLLAPPPKSPLYAGLVISIPVTIPPDEPASPQE